jgi:NAD(P)-dependent dehydrogenase (short-subunit alcohol dehydrogenase family)
MAMNVETESCAKQAPILVTGAGGGIGASLAAMLLEAGYQRLLFHYRQRSQAILEVLERYDVDRDRALFCAELTDEQQVERMHDEIREKHGPLYGLINVAGGSSNAMSWKMSRSEFQEVIDANLLTTFLCCREFIPEMREQGRGRIVNISSVVGFTGVAGAAHYCAAKAGVVGLTKALALELAPKHVIVSALALGYFDYGLIHTIPVEQQERLRAGIPARRFGNCQELGGMIRYLLSEAGAYSAGQVYHLNGGLYS